MIKMMDIKMKTCRLGGASAPEQTFGIVSEIANGRVQYGVWECGPGELDLQFEWSETVFIVDGRAEMENVDTGERIHVEPGSMLAFEKGSRWRWSVPWRLKKIYTILETTT